VDLFSQEFIFPGHFLIFLNSKTWKINFAEHVGTLVSTGKIPSKCMEGDSPVSIVAIEAKE